MSDTLIKRILEAMVDRLEEISTDDGFNTDAGENVALGLRSVDGLEDGDVVVGVYRGKTTVKDDSQPRLAITLPVIVEAHVAAETDAAGTLEDLVGDLKRACLVDHDRTLGGLAKGPGLLRLLSDEVFYPEPGSLVGSARLVFSVSTREPYGDPYTSS
jgi:hypothetical protein